MGYYRGLAAGQKCHRSKADIRHRLSYSRMAFTEISLRQTKHTAIRTMCQMYGLYDFQTERG
jgi:hypothetical protein